MVGIVELIFKSLLSLSKPKPFRELMKEFTDLLFRYGPDSLPVDRFIRRYDYNKEFLRLAIFSIELKRSMDRSEIAWH